MESVTIIDFETDDELGTLYNDGTLETEDEYLREIYEEMTEEGGVIVMTAPDTGNPDELAHGEALVEAGEEGFLLAVTEYLPSPYTVPSDELKELPQYYV